MVALKYDLSLVSNKKYLSNSKKRVVFGSIHVLTVLQKDAFSHGSETVKEKSKISETII